MAEQASRSGRLVSRIAEFYANATKDNYSIDGIYIDSAQGFGAPFLLNYDPDALRNTMSPPVFDASGRAAVLLAADYLDFLANISGMIKPFEGQLFGNAMYMVPHIQFSLLFSVAGIETSWK